ncbi:MAG TPA: chitinase [Polyangiaceae bacterium]|nr:chitinase [Polyangiaceae bacterium]
MKLSLRPLLFAISLAAYGCTTTSSSDDGDLGATGGGTADGAGVGGSGSLGTGGGTGVTPSPITTDALETKPAQVWPTNQACATEFQAGPADDGTGNTVMHLKANGSAGTCDNGSPSVSLSIPQAELTGDVARSMGVKFYIRGASPLDIRFLAQSALVVPSGDGGGSCDAATTICWNAHENAALPVTTDWVEVTVLWDDLVQTWGTEDTDDKKGNLVVLYPSDILLLSWALPSTTGGEIWIDGITLIPNDGSGVQSGVGQLISKAQFNAIVGASSSYTYEGFLASAAAFPAFAGDADLTWAKREIAMFLANAKWETGSFQFVKEQNPGTYCDAGRSYGCPAGASNYYGRGALQLSWNYNYYACGQYLGIDLLNNPNLAETDPALLWETAMWFWMNPGVGGSPHTVFKSGLGETIRSINGLECNGGRPDAVQGRIDHYNSALGALGVDAGGTNGGC